MTSQALRVAALIAIVAAADTTARAQCPDTIPQSLINSVQTPEIRAAAQTFRLDSTMIAQNGGLTTMIRLAKAQLAADRATMAEEQRNQTSLAQNGMGGDRRAADGRTVIRMLEDSQRLTSASIDLMECHARTELNGPAGRASTAPFPGSTIPPRAEMLPAPVPTASSIYSGLSTGSAAPGSTDARSSSSAEGAARTTNAWSMSPAERQSALAGHSSQFRPAPPGENFSQALDSLSRTLHDKAMAKATPEMAAFLAKQDAMRANNDANMAAATAGQAHGLQEARQGSLKDQIQMVTKVVKGWQPPRGYAATSTVNSSALVDPFLAPAVQDVAGAARKAITGSGLEWNEVRKIAWVGSAKDLCGGRLQPGDYPLLPDGNLLDTPERITQFLGSCASPSTPLAVLREGGDTEVRK